MAKQISKNNFFLFEQMRESDNNGNEYWMAKRLSKALDDIDFRKFLSVIEKAIESSGNSHHLSYNLFTQKPL